MSSCRFLGGWLRPALALVFLAPLLAAGPGDEERTGAPESGLSYIPESALALVDLAGGAGAEWTRSEEFRSFLQEAAACLGLEEKILAATFVEEGCTAALLPPVAGEEPAILLVFAGGAARAREFFGTWAGGKGAAGVEGPIHLPAPVNLTFHCTLRDDVLLAATEKKALDLALAARAEPGKKSVLATGAVRKAAAGATPGGLVFSIRSTLLPSDSPLLALAGDGLVRLTWSVGSGGEGCRERFDLKWRSGPASPLDHFRPGPLPAGFANFAPQDALLTLVGSFTPELLEREDLRQWLAARAALPWEELGRTLSGRLAASLTPGGGMIGMLGLADQPLADRVLRSFKEKSGKVSESVCCGYTVYTVKGDKGDGPAWMISGGRLVFAADPTEMEMLIPAISGEAGATSETCPEVLLLRGDPDTAAGFCSGLLKRCLAGLEGEVRLRATLEKGSMSVELLSRGRPSVLALLEDIDFPAPTLADEKPAAAEPLTTPANEKLDSMTERQKYDLLVRLEEKGLDEDTTRDVVHLLADKSPAVASRAAYLLGRLRVQGVAPQLAAVLVGPAPDPVRRYCAYALMQAPDQRAEKALLEALEGGDARTAGLAATALERLGSTAAGLPLARALLRHRQAGEAPRLRILSALARLGGPECFGRVLLGLRGKEPRSLVTARVFFFQETSPRLPRKKEVELLTGLLDFPCPELRRYAVERLGEMGDRTALAPLSRRLQVESTGLKSTLKRTVAALAGPPLPAPKPAEKEELADSLASRFAGLKRKAAALVEEIKLWPDWKKGVLISLPLILFALCLAARSLMKGRSRRRRTRQVSALVAPSDEARAAAEWEGHPMDEELEGGGADTEWEMDLEDTEEVEELIPSASEDEHFVTDEEEERGL